jgi:murein L,D-transpeptidase YcbB/YkuD
LRSEGYLPEPAPAEAPAKAQGEQGKQAPAAAPAPTRYSPELVEAVRRLQQDHGLEASGLIGAETLAALNGGSFERARTLAVNLERRRWLVRQPPQTRVDVNTAAATLAYWRDGQLANQRRVVVGQPGNETPALGSPMFRLVANPTWTVPESIAEEEILPKGGGYMARNNMSMENGRIVQESGPTNSLGLVKFDMKNDHAIYLHDTPAKALFQQTERHHSHGCVRVEDALGFARMIATDQGVLEQWERAQATGEETFVNLAREIPVRLLYHSAFVDGGRVMFRPDPYGWDDDVAEALGLARSARRTVRTHVQDVGP